MSGLWDLTEPQRRQLREAHAAAKGAGFPMREPEPEPMMVSRPCGCTSMVVDGQPVQVSWCVPHDPGYTPPGGEQS